MRHPQIRFAAAICTTLALTLATSACDEKKADAAVASKPANSDKSHPPAPAEEPAPEAEPKKEGIAVHCDEVKRIGTCTETPYASGTWDALGEELLGSRCKGTFGKGECPSEGRLGGCTASNGEIVHYFADAVPKRSAEDAEAHCKDMFAGTWAGA